MTNDFLPREYNVRSRKKTMMTTLNHLKYHMIAFSLILSLVAVSKGGGWAECFSLESLSSHADDQSARLLPWQPSTRRSWKRIKRQDTGLDDESKKTPSASSSLACDFGAADALDFCSWSVPEDAHPNLRWKTGQGTTAYWLGGPLTDKTSPEENTGECC